MFVHLFKDSVINLSGGLRDSSQEWSVFEMLTEAVFGQSAPSTRFEAASHLLPSRNGNHAL